MRRESTRRRDAEAAKLRVRAWDYQAIADELGLASPGAAHDAVRRALSESVREPTEQARDIAAAHLDQLALEAWRLVRTRHVAVSAGRVVEHGGEPVSDAKPVTDALRILVQIEERRAKLLGLDAPRQVVTSVITEATVDAEIARLEEELAQRGEQDSTPP